jgi:hypothetical protein
VILATVQALAALAEKHQAEELRYLETAKPYDFGTDSNLTTIYYRGALLESGRCTEAAAQFRRVLDARLANPNSPYLALAQLGLAEADARAGDVSRRPKGVRSFFSARRATNMSTSSPELSVTNGTDLNRFACPSREKGSCRSRDLT